MSHSIAIEGTEVVFDNPPGQSLLDAALRAGIELPYSCRKGVCGSCVGGIASGDVRGLNGAAIRNETCGPDQVLYCMCEPTTDVVLQPMSWKRIDPSARKTFTAESMRARSPPGILPAVILYVTAVILDLTAVIVRMTRGILDLTAVTLKMTRVILSGSGSF